MRPLGGVLIGIIGDRFGRRAALTFSVDGDGGARLSWWACCRAMQTLGVAAPILLTLLRMIQGLSVGGECTTSIVFMVEHAPPGRRGLIGAIAVCGATAASCWARRPARVMAALLSPDALDDWGWRMPFLLGLLVGMAGYLPAPRASRT